MRRALLALVAASLVSQPALAAEPIVLKPASPWNVDFGEDKCRVSRLFGESTNRHILTFDQFAPSDNFGMMVAGAGFKSFGSLRKTELQFFAAQTPLVIEPFGGKAAEYGNALVLSAVNLAKGTNLWSEKDKDSEKPVVGVPALDIDFAAQTEFVSLRQTGKQVSLMTGPLNEVFKVLNLCSEDLAKSWGIDVERHRTASKTARFVNDQVIARKIQSVYPTQALVQGEQAIVRMRVIISETGAIEDCAIIRATDNRLLESPACSYMQKAQFEPALDAEGKPMRSYYTSSITYRSG